MCIAVGIIGAAVIGAAATAAANDQNRQLAHQQTDVQVDTSNTAYQRAVADMKAAGLNPMLAYTQGGASTVTGAQAKMEPLISPSSAVDVARAVYDVQQTIAATGKTNAEAEVAKAQVPNMVADARLKNATAAQSEYDLKNKAAWVAETAKHTAGLTKAQKLQAEIDADLANQNWLAVTHGHDATDVYGWNYDKWKDHETPYLRGQRSRYESAVRREAADAELLSLGIPAAGASAELARSWWGQKVSPVLRDVGSITGSAGRVGRMIGH